MLEKTAALCGGFGIPLLNLGYTGQLLCGAHPTFSHNMHAGPPRSWHILQHPFEYTEINISFEIVFHLLLPVEWNGGWTVNSMRSSILLSEYSQQRQPNHEGQTLMGAVGIC